MGKLNYNISKKILENSNNKIEKIKSGSDIKVFIIWMHSLCIIIINSEIKMDVINYTIGYLCVNTKLFTIE